MSRAYGRWALAVLLGVWPAGASREAAAQGLGSGPLTGTLVDSEPTSGVIDLGRVKLAPGMTIQEFGWDSNVFDERENPKDDWVFRGKPDVAIYSTLRWVRVSAYAGSELAYYRTYDSERSAGYEYRGRLDMTVSRLYPFLGGGFTKHRTRPNGEIDVRADEELAEVSGGLAFELGPNSVLYGSAMRYRTDYSDSLEDGIDLETTLNRETESYSGGVRTDISPITTLTVFGGVDRDRFDESPLRDTDTNFVTATIRIGPEALISGTGSVSYRDFQPVDPLVEPYRGLTGEVSASYSFLEVGRLTGGYRYGLEYSFDAAEAYYTESSLSLTYTHRLFGEVDAQVRGSKSWFDYGYREGVEARTDTLGGVNVSVGYNLRNRTRISLHYEEARRRSPAYLDRNYDRTRVYLAWVFAL